MFTGNRPEVKERLDRLVRPPVEPEFSHKQPCRKMKLQELGQLRPKHPAPSPASEGPGKACKGLAATPKGPVRAPATHLSEAGAKSTSKGQPRPALPPMEDEGMLRPDRGRDSAGDGREQSSARPTHREAQGKQTQPHDGRGGLEAATGKAPAVPAISSSPAPGPPKSMEGWGSGHSSEIADSQSQREAGAWDNARTDGSGADSQSQREAGAWDNALTDGSGADSQSQREAGAWDNARAQTFEAGGRLRGQIDPSPTPLRWRSPKLEDVGLGPGCLVVWELLDSPSQEANAHGKGGRAIGRMEDDQHDCAGLTARLDEAYGELGKRTGRALDSLGSSRSARGRIAWRTEAYEVHGELGVRTEIRSAFVGSPPKSAQPVPTSMGWESGRSGFVARWQSEDRALEGVDGFALKRPKPGGWGQVQLEIERGPEVVGAKRATSPPKSMQSLGAGPPKSTPQSMEDWESGPPKSTPKSMEGWESGLPKSTPKSMEDWESGPPKSMQLGAGQGIGLGVADLKLPQLWAPDSFLQNCNASRLEWLQRPISRKQRLSCHHPLCFGLAPV
ncbi:unnamed protein product [Effrenium voratum]|nr:unnamed protein product [Effrenium voratum]